MKYIPFIGWEKWGYSRTVMLHECPKCGQQKEYHCKTPKGKKTWPPHKERVYLQIVDMVLGNKCS